MKRTSRDTISGDAFKGGTRINGDRGGGRGGDALRHPFTATGTDHVSGKQPTNHDQPTDDRQREL